MSLKIDHVTIAGQALADLEEAFASVDLQTEYGGPHSNGITHMSFLGFEDGSYLELIALLDPGGPASPWWHRQIAGNAGLAAWAVDVPDVAVEAARLSAAGIQVDGPKVMRRVRPDGAVAEWSLAFVGPPPPGSVLPFIIADRGPRENRVRPSRHLLARDASGALRPDRVTGIAEIVLGVRSIDGAAALFRQAHGWSRLSVRDDEAFGARLAHFEGTPVTLAEPAAPGTWLARRLDAFGDAPCACLLRAPDAAAAASRYRLYGRSTWFTRPAAWFDPVRLNGIRLGVVGEP
jgi:hypothetical protein